MTDLELAARQALEALERIGMRDWVERKEEAITALRRALEQQYSATSDHRLMEQPEFITHSVDQPYDWSKWVCPDPKSYLMKCCGCGLIHEAQFGVVRYKSETEREDCEPVDDPNLQAVFRMRRSEQWSPEDTAYRPGGLSPEQPAQQERYMKVDGPLHVVCQCDQCKAQQEPVAWRDHVEQRLLTWRQSFVNKSGDQLALEDFMDKRSLDDLIDFVCSEYTRPQARKWVGLTEEEVGNFVSAVWPREATPADYIRAIEAKLREKNT